MTSIAGRASRGAGLACLALVLVTPPVASAAGRRAEAVAAPKRPGPAIYRIADHVVDGVATDPCGNFSIGLDGRKRNCTPTTRRTTRSERRPIYYDVYGQRGELPSWVVDRPDQIVADPTTTVAPVRGLFEVATVGADGASGATERLCLDSVAAIEALFQRQRGADCGLPGERLVTSEDVLIAGPCSRGSAKLWGTWSASAFELHTLRLTGGTGRRRGPVVAKGRRLSPSCARPAEPRW